VPVTAGGATATGTVPGMARTGPLPRKRTPTTDDASAIRELIAERVALLDGEADHYALLGIERSADANAVRAAYFELARLLHPDRLSALGIADDDRAAQRLFARINDAFTVLSTATRRAEYDTLLDAGGPRAAAEREAAATAQAQAAVEAEERYRLGEMAMRRQQAEIAVHEFHRAVELKPDEPDYLTLLGWALYVAARDKVAAVTVARAHLQKALTLKKETALPWLYLGRIARMEGEDDEASRAFRRALQISPTNSEAQAELRVVEARRRSKPSTRGGLFSRLGKKP
ncbi:MAG TPA: DnaJ domain-containing protein, partial [Kofleriaceae bacterium]|nr:DnaJ domain-containing protein [Kofleriaceae bacterium]